MSVVFAVVAYAAGRWWIVAVAVATWSPSPCSSFANNGWYGHGWGDFGVTPTVIAGCLPVAPAALGVAARAPLECRPAG